MNNKELENIIEKARVEFTAKQMAEIIKNTIETLNTVLKNNIYLIEDMANTHKNVRDMFNLTREFELETAKKLYNESFETLIDAVGEYIPAYLSTLVIERCENKWVKLKE